MTSGEGGLQTWFIQLRAPVAAKTTIKVVAGL